VRIANKGPSVTPGTNDVVIDPTALTGSNALAIHTLTVRQGGAQTKLQALLSQDIALDIGAPGMFAITKITGAAVTIGTGMLRRAGGIYTASGGGSITIAAAGQWIAAAFDGSSLSIQGPFTSIPQDTGGMAYFPLYQMAFNVGANGPQTWPTLDCRNMLFPSMFQP